jgi:K+-transporting ATPase ATPase A chain
MGPAASQVAIKQLGSNGGGFFNVNSSHPYENPTPFSNFLELLSILLIPAASCFSFGKMSGDTRQGWAIFAAMNLIFIPLMLFCFETEQAGNPNLTALNIDQKAANDYFGGNMEGKETRFGITNSTLWTSAATATSNGSVNSMIDSYTPLGGFVPLILMNFGEVIYGGVGSGLYTMLVCVVITVFIAGLMIGRTPEYLGKKITPYDMKMCSIILLIPPLLVLIGTAIAVITNAGQAGVSNPGPHGFSEILYGFSSAAANNGSSFAGLNSNTIFYNTALGISILCGRYFIIIPVLALAGSFVTKQKLPVSEGTLPTHNLLFVYLIAGVTILVVILTYIPAIALGPIIEHLKLWKNI